MGNTFKIFQIRGNPVGLGAKVLSNIPVSEKISQQQFQDTGKHQSIRKNIFFRGNKRNT